MKYARHQKYLTLCLLVCHNFDQCWRGVVDAVVPSTVISYFISHLVSGC